MAIQHLAIACSHKPGIFTATDAMVAKETTLAADFADRRQIEQESQVILGNG
jgi:hypothetical protein